MRSIIGPAMTAVLLAMITTSALAQFAQPDPTTTPSRYGETQTQRWKAGIIVQANSGPCTGIVGYTTVPTDWPEQEVKIVEEDISPNARVTYKMVDNMAKQMTVQIPRIASGQTAKAVVTFEVTRKTMYPPTNTAAFRMPDTDKLDFSVRKFLGASPLIETTDPRIRSLAAELTRDIPGAWDKVEAIYDWVRDNVEYKNGPIKGARAALNDGTGDCEELTSLFIALCRNVGIPARTVWVDGHCYPEFYLVDSQERGYWLPCQAAGSRALGGILEARPVLQKGDSIRPTYKRSTPQRYLADHLVGSGDSRPSVQFVRQRAAN